MQTSLCVRKANKQKVPEVAIEERARERGIRQGLRCRQREVEEGLCHKQLGLAQWEALREFKLRWVM